MSNNGIPSNCGKVRTAPRYPTSAIDSQTEFHVLAITPRKPIRIVSAEDLDAAITLLSISRSNSSTTHSANDRPGPATVRSFKLVTPTRTIYKANRPRNPPQTDSSRDEPPTVTQRLQAFSLALHGPASDRAADAQADNLTPSALSETAPKQFECPKRSHKFRQPANDVPDSVNPTLPQVIRSSDSSEVLDAVDDFVNTLGRYGNRADSIQNALRSECTILPIQEVFHRLERCLNGSDAQEGAGDEQKSGPEEEDEEMTEANDDNEGDDTPKQSWEEQLEMWFEFH